MEEKINAIMIFEALGKPPEYVKEILNNITLNIEKEKDVVIISKKIAEPKEIEDNVYSSFSEVEIETKDLLTFLNLIFRYFPSNVEVIEPQQLVLKNFDFNAFLNELITQLHKYDEIAKIALVERNIMIKQLKFLNEKLKEVNQQKNKSKKRNKTKKK